MTGEDIFIIACTIFVYGQYLLWIKREEKRLKGE